MSKGTKEVHFEEHIVAAMVRHGWQEFNASEVEGVQGVIRTELVTFLKQSQADQWARLVESGSEDQAEDLVMQRTLRKLRDEKAGGAIALLRNTLRVQNASFEMAFPAPSNDLNPELERQHACNRFAVVRQVRCHHSNNETVDLVFFLNGIAIATVELKNSLTGQTVWNAVAQYRARDAKLPLFAKKRVPVHFAVDDCTAQMCTGLRGSSSRFLPFTTGQGVASTDGDYASSYLWEEVWIPASMLELMLHFVHEQTNVELSYDRKRNSIKEDVVKFTVFPRFHQRRVVRNILQSLENDTAKKNFLVQHSAGSGKSNSIVWLAYRLSMFFQQHTDTKRFFDTIFVVTDRRVLDKQLQANLLQFKNIAPGAVEAIDHNKTSQHLRMAIEEGRHIVVTTLQKFPVISDEVSNQQGKRFAVIIDEAHSSQSGDSARELRKALSGHDAAVSGDMDLDAVLEANIARKGVQENLYYFAFTATPKERTLQMFGTEDERGDMHPFDVYSMGQAINEGFILDVLSGFVSFRRYFELTTSDGTETKEYDESKAIRLLKSWVDLQPDAIEQKAGIMLDHFSDKVVSMLEGQARAMVVTKSRLAAARYKRAFDKLLAQRNAGYGALVAFSGKVFDPDLQEEFTPEGMNQSAQIIGSKREIPEALKFPQFRILIVADMYQTGFDEPLLNVMYVDKKLGGVSTVQTLSRLNRTKKGKTQPMVLDFVNDPEEIRSDFVKYYGANRVNAADRTNPDVLYDLMDELDGFYIFSEEDCNVAAEILLKNEETERLYALLDRLVIRYNELEDEERQAFKSCARDFVRLYRFIAQIVTWQALILEKYYLLLGALLKKLPYEPSDLPYHVVQDVELTRYVISKRMEGSLDLELEDELSALKGRQLKSATHVEDEDEMTRLEEIIRDLNEISTLTEDNEDVRSVVAELDRRLAENEGLAKVFIPSNSRDDVKRHFARILEETLYEIGKSRLGTLRELTRPEIMPELTNQLFKEAISRASQRL